MCQNVLKIDIYIYIYNRTLHGIYWHKLLTNTRVWLTRMVVPNDPWPLVSDSVGPVVHFHNFKPATQTTTLKNDINAT